MTYVLIGFCLIQTVLMAQRVTYQDTFEGDLDTTVWFVEKSDGINNRVVAEKGQLLIDVGGSATIWFKKELTGNRMIEFDRTVLVEGKINDRLADVEVFWQATGPQHTPPFGRNTAFENYESLRLYYAEMGGNQNKTTRFLKYAGESEQTLLLEYTDASHLLTANQVYHFQITVQNRITQLYVNNRLFFSFTDDDPLTNGYFGFRTTKSRQVIDNFKVVPLK